jgi:hypothetical protein
MGAGRGVGKYSAWHQDEVRRDFSLLGMRMRGLGFHCLVIGGYALLTVILTYPLVMHLNTHIPSYPSDPGIGDTWVNMWGFGFIHRIVTESTHWSLFTDTIFYPRGVDLTIPLVFGVGLPLAVSIPLVHFLGIIVTYNLFIIGSFILTAYATFLLSYYLIKDTRAALLSGVIFAFAPYHMVRALAHLNILASGMLIPLYILLLIKTMKNGYITNILLSSFILSSAVVFNLYYAFYLCFLTALYVLYHIYFDDCRIHKKLMLKRLLFIALTTSTFCLPVGWMLITHGWEDFHSYIPRSISFQFGADLLAFFLPSSFHTVWGNLVRPFYLYHFTGGETEQTVYVGYAVLAFSLIAVLKAPGKETRFWVLSALGFFVLALGPFLHINGHHTLDAYGIPISIPLPYLLLLFIPLLQTLRVASRSGIMVMLALAILSAYGARQLLRRLGKKSGVGLLCLGLIGTSIIFEALIIPLPLVDARIPKVYENIATESRYGGTLIDVPLHWALTKYQYYQTSHGMRLLLGQAPRLSVELLTTYADSVSFMKLFKSPALIQDYEDRSINRRDILRFIEFFDLSFIVIHKDLLGSQIFDQSEHFGKIPSGSRRLQGPEVFERLMRFFLANFPVHRVEEEGDIVTLQLAKSGQNADLWVKGNIHHEDNIDFDADASQFFFAEGWWPPERIGELTFAWANAHESRLGVRFAQPEDFMMELRLIPITIPGGPRQAVTIYANKRLLGEVPLKADDWHLYTVPIPKTYLTPGLNTFRFVYRYTASPAEVYPGNGDARKLAVAFDFIRFRAER